MVAVFGDELWPGGPSGFDTDFVLIACVFPVGIIIQIGWIDERTRGVDDITIGSDVVASSVPETFAAFFFWVVGNGSGMMMMMMMMGGGGSGSGIGGGRGGRRRGRGMGEGGGGGGEISGKRGMTNERLSGVRMGKDKRRKNMGLDDRHRVVSLEKVTWMRGVGRVSR